MKYKTIKILLIVGAAASVAELLIHLLCFVVLPQEILEARGMDFRSYPGVDPECLVMYGLEALVMVFLCIFTLVNGRKQIKLSPFWGMAAALAALRLAEYTASFFYRAYSGMSYDQLAAYAVIQNIDGFIAYIPSIVTLFCAFCAAGAALSVGGKAHRKKSSGKVFAWVSAGASAFSSLHVLIICTIGARPISSLFIYEYTPVNTLPLLLPALLVTCVCAAIAILTTVGVMPRRRWLLAAAMFFGAMILSYVISRLSNRMMMTEQGTMAIATFAAMQNAIALVTLIPSLTASAFMFIAIGRMIPVHAVTEQ